MLTAESITIVRNGRLILADVSLRLAPGRLIALLGPNGAGKSTLLRALSGEVRPTSGRVTLDGVDVATIAARALAARRAVVPQTTSLAFPFTVLEVVMLGALVPGFALDDRAATPSAKLALAEAGLSGFEDRNYSQLSGGEKQRVHIARALCQLAIAGRDTSLSRALLLDEPTSSLDLAHQRLIVRQLRRQAEAGRAVLMVAHDMNLAAAVADEIVLMAGGRVAAHGSATDVIRSDLLSRVYDCDIVVSPAAGGTPWVLPMPLCSEPRGAAAE